MKKNIKVRYFALLREQTQKSTEILETRSKTPEELFEELKDKYHFTLDFNSVRVAINEKYASSDTEISNGDELVFIPPVAGG